VPHRGDDEDDEYWDEAKKKAMADAIRQTVARYRICRI